MAVVDGEGQFKFVEIEITETETKRVKNIVRGFNGLTHPEILKKFITEELQAVPVDVKSKW